MHYLGKVLFIVGVFLIVGGLIIYFWGNKFSWLGHLPGDIRVERENFKFYFPITTMIILSIVVSVIIRIIQKFMN